MPFHINPETGEPRVCTATVRSCKYAKGEEIPAHYETQKEARLAYEEQNKAKAFTAFASSIKAGELSAKMSTTYAQWALINDHLHCASAVGNDAEQFYYSSPAGELELQRRSSLEKENDPHSPHREIARTLKEKGAPRLELTAEERRKFNEHLKAGFEQVKAQSQAKAIEFKKVRKNADLGAYLVDKSSEWFSKLTPKEQDAIAYSTSSGFFLVEGSIDPDEVSKQTKTAVKLYYPEETSAFEQSVSKLGYTEKEERERVEKTVDFYHSKAKEFTEILKSTIAKAPKLEVPIKLYRGVKINQFMKDFSNEGETIAQAKERLLTGGGVGEVSSRIDDEGNPSKLAHGPISTSLNPVRAMAFTETHFENNQRLKVMYEIEATTMASPVVASAWGHGEAEVFTNHNSDYQITGARSQDDVLIIALKELPN